MRRIAALESLRGLLALWVLVGHAIRQAGYTTEDFGPFKVMAMPGYAVDVFIILSGFVIFYLLHNQPLTYRGFICRRFFRLAPLYFTVIAVAASTLQWQIAVNDTLPRTSDSLRTSMQLRADSIEYFGAHLLAHATMLHGLIDSRILPSSEYAFVGQAWSISVEWQFYLVAPFLFWMITARRWQALMVALVTICVLRFTNYGGEGFAIKQAGFFMTGILSFYVYRRLHMAKIDAKAIDAMIIVAVTAIYMFLANSVSMIVWACVFGLLIASTQASQTAFQRIGLGTLHHPALLWLGRISYSVYMVNGLVIFLVTDLIFSFIPGVDRGVFFLILLPASIALTLVVSALTFRYIERPGISLGQRLSTMPQPLEASGTP